MATGESGRRRAPEASTLHEAFRRGWPSVSGLLPRHLQEEASRFLACGDVRFGFVEVACASCDDARLVAFSCKGRGWCPSCTTRRALDTGAHLEAVLPRVAHRQWTLSLPMALRFHVVKQPALLKQLEVRLVRAVWRLQRATARRLGHEGTLSGGAVCFWQYFGSSLQLTPHLHLLAPEALWRVDGVEVPLPPPSEDEVAAVLHRVLRLARDAFADGDVPFPDDDFEGLQLRALQRPLPLRLPKRPARRLASAYGFSLHADTAVHENDRQGLERLCRYGARGPVAESRLRKLDDGRYEYSPKKGVAFTLTAEALVKRLVALTPPPNRHLTSFHGVYAPNARLRPLVLTPRALAPQSSPPSSPPPRHQTAPPPRPRLDWAALHQRTFGNDVLQCPCGGRRTVRRVHLTRKAAEARLAELGVALPSRLLPPPTAPPQLVLDVE